ncbi:MAG: hypothetical protein ACKOFC_01770 [Solirubrobacterales bacterium]
MPVIARLFTSTLVIGAVLAPAASAAPPKIGLADQNASAYANPLFKVMGITYGRVTIPWNAATTTGFRRDDADNVINAMKADGVEPVAVIGSRDSGRPSMAAYKRAAAALVKRYPTVKYWAPWNEANLTAFTKRDPKMVAGWTRILQAACKKATPRCSVASPTVLDETSIGPWFQQYLSYLPRSARPKVWLMHNYMDANRFRVKNGKPFLVAARKARAQVWIVETGGLIRGNGKNARKWRKGQAQQVKVFKWLTGPLPRQYPVVKRIYIYQWQAPPRGNWDSGILSPDGFPREVYGTMVDYLKKNPE